MENLMFFLVGEGRALASLLIFLGIIFIFFLFMTPTGIRLLEIFFFLLRAGLSLIVSIPVLLCGYLKKYKLLFLTLFIVSIILFLIKDKITKEEMAKTIMITFLFLFIFSGVFANKKDVQY